MKPVLCVGKGKDYDFMLVYVIVPLHTDIESLCTNFFTAQY